MRNKTKHPHKLLAKVKTTKVFDHSPLKTTLTGTTLLYSTTG